MHLTNSVKDILFSSKTAFLTAKTLSVRVASPAPTIEVLLYFAPPAKRSVPLWALLSKVAEIKILVLLMVIVKV